jgi:hypothetical protein
MPRAWRQSSGVEALNFTHINPLAGLTGARTALVTMRPCRAPHHTLSDVGLISGGQVPRPGEVPLAHHGVRFLDERPGCTRHVLEALCRPIEEGVTRIPSPARHKSPYIGGVRQTDDGCKGFGQSPLATHHRDGHHTRGVTASLTRSSLCSRVMLFA